MLESVSPIDPRWIMAEPLENQRGHHKCCSGWGLCERGRAGLPLCLARRGWQDGPPREHERDHDRPRRRDARLGRKSAHLGKSLWALGCRIRSERAHHNWGPTWSKYEHRKIDSFTNIPQHFPAPMPKRRIPIQRAEQSRNPWTSCFPFVADFLLVEIQDSFAEHFDQQRHWPNSGIFVPSNFFVIARVGYILVDDGQR